MHILITMAGLGSRFREQGYTIPKYQIEVRGRTLFAWSMESLRNFFPGNHTTFVVRREDKPEAFIRKEIQAFGVPDPTILSLDEMTDGQATTVLKSLPTLRRLEPGAPLLVYNIDTYVEPGNLHPRDVRGDGWIPCFPGKGEAWSFFKCGEDGKVTDAREKVRIADHASIGLYYFRSLELFEKVYGAYFGGGLPDGLKEKYIAPMYREMIRQGKELWIHAVPENAVHPLGTPEEVEAFQMLGLD